MAIIGIATGILIFQFVDFNPGDDINGGDKETNDLIDEENAFLVYIYVNSTGHVGTGPTNPKRIAD
ncbi:MAG: hypothetical protein ACOC4M_03160 [Promethearchaeia archaeon]